VNVTSKIGHMSPISNLAEVNRSILVHLSKNGAQTNTQRRRHSERQPF
jgi:hypothetical protein